MESPSSNLPPTSRHTQVHVRSFSSVDNFSIKVAVVTNLVQNFQLDFSFKKPAEYAFSDMCVPTPSLSPPGTTFRCIL